MSDFQVKTERANSAAEQKAIVMEWLSDKSNQSCVVVCFGDDGMRATHISTPGILMNSNDVLAKAFNRVLEANAQTLLDATIKEAGNIAAQAVEVDKEHKGYFDA